MWMNIVTVVAIAVVTALLIGWDIVVVTNGGRTISNYLLNMAREFMIIAFAWGMLGGHFFAFHFRSFTSAEQTWRSLVLGATGLLILGWDVWMQWHPFPADSWQHWLRYPFFWFCFGVFAGWALFPQTSDFNFEYLRNR